MINGYDQIWGSSAYDVGFIIFYDENSTGGYNNALFIRKSNVIEMDDHAIVFVMRTIKVFQVKPNLIWDD